MGMGEAGNTEWSMAPVCGIPYLGEAALDSDKLVLTQMHFNYEFFTPGGIFKPLL